MGRHQGCPPCACFAPTRRIRRTPTRADVERDLAAWRESGLEAQWAGDETPDVNSPTYISDYRKYQSTIHGGSMSQPASQSQTESQRRW